MTKEYLKFYHMKKVFIIANWKSNMTVEETNRWFEEESNIEIFITNALLLKDKIGQTDEAGFEKEIIICPPFTLFSTLKNLIEQKKLPFKIGAQNVSLFDQGPYTGEINAKQIKEFGDYVIIGHSERRRNMGESDEMTFQKTNQALKNGLTPIYCVQDENAHIPNGVRLAAYEPPGAIGTGNPDSPENAHRVAGEIKRKHPEIEDVIYGGSVNSENIQSYIQKDTISGVLVGGASLDPVKFAALVKEASF